MNMNITIHKDQRSLNKSRKLNLLTKKSEYLKMLPFYIILKNELETVYEEKKVSFTTSKLKLLICINKPRKIHST